MRNYIGFKYFLKGKVNKKLSRKFLACKHARQAGEIGGAIAPASPAR